MPAREPLSVELDGDEMLGPCPCCGHDTRRVWGYVHRGKATKAAYFVEWVPGQVNKHGAGVDMILGRWGQEASPDDRVAVSAVFRFTPNGPQFMVVDSAGRPTDSPMVRSALNRSQVIGTPTAKEAFAIIDAVWLGDPRIAELTASAG